MTKIIDFWASKSITDESSQKSGPFREVYSNGKQCARCDFLSQVSSAEIKCAPKQAGILHPPHFRGNWLRCPNMPVKESIDPEQY
jgi:hypothetical protein